MSRLGEVEGVAPWAGLRLTGRACEPSGQRGSMSTVESAEQTGVDDPKRPVKDAGELRALGKAIAILGALGDLGGRASLSEIVRHCGLAKTTVHRVLSALLAHGAVVRMGDEYVVGALLHVAASCPVDQGASLRHIVKPFLLDIYVKTRQPVALLVLAEHSLVCIDLVYGHGQRDEAPPLQRPLPPQRCAAGKLFLAFDLVAATIPAHPAWFAGDVPALSGTLAGEIAQIRHDGVARCGAGRAEGIASLAAPIRAGGGRLAAAIEVYGRAERFPWLAAEAAVRQAAYGASTLLRPGRLGYRTAERQAATR